MFDAGLLTLIFCLTGAGLIAGFYSAITGMMLDHLMDYGHVFSRIRERKAIKSMDKNELTDLKPKFKEVDGLNENWQSKAEIMNDYYMFLAGLDKSFAWIVCPYCISMRICLLAGPAFALMGGLVLGHTWEIAPDIIGVLLISLPITHRFVNYFDR